MNQLSGNEGEHRKVFSLLGEKWSTECILLLEQYGKLRFNELLRKINDQERGTGVSKKMLAARLRALEEEGLLLRESFHEMPPRVEYQLTHAGKSILPLLEEVMTWARVNMQASR
jgi:DNA-binding HxlR family transcriptional regulator